MSDNGITTGRKFNPSWKQELIPHFRNDNNILLRDILELDRCGTKSSHRSIPMLKSIKNIHAPHFEDQDVNNIIDSFG